MASGGKKRTTMAKLNRESKQRERRQDKLARKEARKLAPPEAEVTPRRGRRLLSPAERGARRHPCRRADAPL